VNEDPLGGRVRGRFAAAVAFLLALPTPPAHAAAPPSACAYLAGLVDPAAGPVFLASYPTVGTGALHGAAFLYDNAVAAIALVGCGEVGRARAIGDAILQALGHDRAWRDGRLRNGYAAGPVDAAPVKLAGWWDDVQGRWLEDGYQAGSDTGNMAWAMLALLAIDRAAPADGAASGAAYRAAAVRIGAWVAAKRDMRGSGGFTGGVYGWESAPRPLSWKSTEHNTDLAAAFRLLGAATGDPVWTERAAEAERFVRAMWLETCHCFAVGTLDDGVTPGLVVALDAQLWPLLAIPGFAASPHLAALETSERLLRAPGRAGFTYSDAGQGLWTEGTAQAALVARLLGRKEEWAALTASIEAERAPDGGYYATDVAELATGFGDAADPSKQRAYYRLPHLAPAAWAALAERGFNPFTASPALPAAEPAPPR